MNSQTNSLCFSHSLAIFAGCFALQLQRNQSVLSLTSLKCLEFTDRVMEVLMLQESPQLPLPGLQLHCLSHAQQPHHTKPYSSWAFAPALGSNHNWTVCLPQLPQNCGDKHLLNPVITYSSHLQGQLKQPKGHCKGQILKRDQYF